MKHLEETIIHMWLGRQDSLLRAQVLCLREKKMLAKNIKLDTTELLLFKICHGDNEKASYWLGESIYRMYLTKRFHLKYTNKW